MVVAGMAWGGIRYWAEAVVNQWSTTSNFIRAVPFAIRVSLVTVSMLHWSWWDVGLAIASGVFASGLDTASGTQR